MSAIKKHLERWKNCTACELHKERTNVVLARGTVPCDVCFVGLAPGDSEDLFGVPFVGPAGESLDGIIESAFSERALCPKCRSLQFLHQSSICMTCQQGHYYRSGVPIRLAFTNLIACIPRPHDKEGQVLAGVEDPADKCVRACSGRLQEFLLLAQPRLIVCVGSVAEDWLQYGYSTSIKLHRHYDKQIPIVAIRHPSWLLRLNSIMRGIETQRQVVVLRNALREILPLNP